MKKNPIFIVFASLLLAIIIATTGCAWIGGISDTNPYDDSPSDDKTYRKQFVEQVRQKLLGTKKEDVLKELGKPSWINQLGNYQMISKFRDDQVVFDGTKKCRMAECGPIFAEESWAYGWKRKTEKHFSHYGFGVFFKDNVVVSVE